MTTETAIRVKFHALASRLDEHTRRVWAATEADSIGYGGISLVAHATGISRRAILVGLREVKEGNILPEGQVRRLGGGRKSAVHHQPRSAGKTGGSGGAFDSRRPDVAVALDVQEYASSFPGIDHAWIFSEQPSGGNPSPWDGLQPPGQPQDD